MNQRKIKKYYATIKNVFIKLFNYKELSLKDKIKKILKNKLSKNTDSKREYKNIVLNKIEKKSFIKRQSKKNIQINLLENCVLKKHLFNIFIAILIVAILSITFLSFGPFFKIKNNKGVDISKKGNITNMPIAYESVKYIRGKSIFNIDKLNVEKKLKLYQENIKEIKINISLPDKIKILIESYKGVFNITINNKSYIVTENGVLVPLKHDKSLRTIELKTSKNLTNKFLDYKIFFKEKFIKNINTIINKVESGISDIIIEKIYYYETEREVHIITEDSTILIFNIDGDIDEQIEKLIILKKDYKKIYNTPIFYIDLRIMYKIYVCTNEEEYLCKRNIKNIYSYE